MAFVYFLSTDGENIICMDAETDISVQRSNKVTSSSVMTGTNRSDGYEIGRKSLSISGVITYSKTPRQKFQGNPTPLQFQELLEELVLSKQRFTVYSNKQGEQLFDDLDDCVIVNHSVQSRDLNSITANITVQEQFVSDAARVTTLPPKLSKEVEAGLSDTKDQGKGTSTEAGEEVKETLLRRGISGVGDFLGG